MRLVSLRGACHTRENAFGKGADVDWISVNMIKMQEFIPTLSKMGEKERNPSNGTAGFAASPCPLRFPYGQLTGKMKTNWRVNL